jgi:UDP-N-acetylmuramate--alanine ligase
VRATLQAARDAYEGRRIVAVFQPHLFTRTRDFHQEFGVALGGADEVWVADVFPAREKPIPGVSGELIADAARATGVPVHYHAHVDALGVALAEAVKNGDVVITMGAGDVDRVGRGLWRVLSESGGSSARDAASRRHA